MDGDLFTLVDPNSRYYGVKLGTGNISADLANKAFELKGLVIESSNKRLGASTYEGLTATFNANGTALTLAGTIDQALAPFSVVSLPTVITTQRYSTSRRIRSLLLIMVAYRQLLLPIQA